MTTTCVLFIQGGGKGAHREDALLADSLKAALGSEFEVHYPKMPAEADPSTDSWNHKISSELSNAHGKVILVAHSVGASIVLKLLAERAIQRHIDGLFLLAAPSWDEQDWNFDDLKLPLDVAEKLSGIRRIYFYHCRDDDVVPFAHLALHAARLPRAIIRAADSGGHQFDNDLSSVARDIRDNVE